MKVNGLKVNDHNLMALVSIHTAANKRNKKISSRIDINDNLLLTSVSTAYLHKTRREGRWKQIQELIKILIYFNWQIVTLLDLFQHTAPTCMIVCKQVEKVLVSQVKSTQMQAAINQYSVLLKDKLFMIQRA